MTLLKSQVLSILLFCHPQRVGSMLKCVLLRQEDICSSKTSIIQICPCPEEEDTIFSLLSLFKIKETFPTRLQRTSAYISVVRIVLHALTYISHWQGEWATQTKQSISAKCMAVWKRQIYLEKVEVHYQEAGSQKNMAE